MATRNKKLKLELSVHGKKEAAAMLEPSSPGELVITSAR
jgi:hypothetical protein